MSDFTASRRLTGEVAILAGRLARALESSGPVDGQNFLQAFYECHHGATPLAQWQDDPLRRLQMDAAHPLCRMARLFGWDPLDVDLVLLAGMPEEHEGFAAVLRTLHPRAEARPSAGLAWYLFSKDDQARLELRARLETGPAASNGAFRLAGDAPFPDCSIQLADRLWPVLHGLDVWPAPLARIDAQPVTDGLEEWLETPAAQHARAGIESGKAVTVLVSAESEHVAFPRALAFAAAAGAHTASLQVPYAMDPDAERLVQLHCAARDVVPVLKMAVSESGSAGRIPEFRRYPAPVVVAVRTGMAAYQSARPLLSLHVERLSAPARQRMWTRLVPALEQEAPVLAAQFPIEPALARDAAGDLAFVASIERRAITVPDVAEVLRARANQLLSGGIELIRPTATWATLVLPPDRECQLREAANRLRQQGRVLDEWGFLRGRPGARGVRLLFSGPPGTGKTLSAEVVAGELGVDLLLVDISRVVSKWIGETEKNLAAVFDTAEKARAVLFFDEADALFGKRTEVSDAHDRYANLESAYLLARLERFDGLAILATNLRNNIDMAVMRRMEFSLDFSEPGREDRVRLWRAHVPEGAPLAADVDLDELAALFPMVGALIRNASVAAAFLAAGDGGIITRRHMFTAVRREYEKACRAFPAALEHL